MTADELNLEQFRALRAEILRAIEDGNQVMAFGLAAIGLVLAAGLEARDTLLGFMIFISVLPALALIVLSMWFSSLERLARASYFVSGIERRLARSIGASAPPTWDLWLRRAMGQKTNHFWSNDFAGIAMFGFLVVAALVMAVMVPGGGLGLRWRLLILAPWIVVLTFFARSMNLRFRRWQEWLNNEFDGGAA